MVACGSHHDRENASHHFEYVFIHIAGASRLLCREFLTSFQE